MAQIDLDRPVSEIMSRAPRTVGMEDDLEQVEKVLRSRRLSAVPVVDLRGGLFGIISLSDVMRLRATKHNVKALRAWEGCTYKPITVAPDVSLRDVAALMVKKKIHHIVVLDDRLLKGIISTWDFVEQLVLHADRDPQFGELRFSI